MQAARDGVDGTAAQEARYQSRVDDAAAGAVGEKDLFVDPVAVAEEEKFLVDLEVAFAADTVVVEGKTSIVGSGETLVADIAAVVDADSVATVAAVEEKFVAGPVVEPVVVRVKES